ncbi:hypothetical protein [Halolamina sp. C58]|uniref:hypothetical protein n=1 Tax=Halolamina sp. C58 TaxID=3421640 RepID=UPI003EB9F0CF
MLPILLKLVPGLSGFLLKIIKIAIFVGLIVVGMMLMPADVMAAETATAGVSAASVNSAGEYFQQQAPEGSDSGSGTIPDWLTDSEDEEQESNPWQSVLADDEWTGLAVYHVEYDYENDVAKVYVEATDRVQITVTDGTRTQTGFHNRVTTTLDPAEGETAREVIEVQLWKTSNEHISVGAEDELWSHFGNNSDLRTDESVQYPIILAPFAGALALIMVVGLHKYSARYRESAKNPIKG